MYPCVEEGLENTLPPVFRPGDQHPGAAQLFVPGLLGVNRNALELRVDLTFAFLFVPSVFVQITIVFCAGHAPP